MRGRKSQAAGMSLAEARRHAPALDWDRYQPPAPRQPGVQVFDAYDLAELVEYIDWMPFFNAWEFAGRFPDILQDPVVGESASSLYRDARAMLERIVAERWFTPRGVIGLFPANARGDDIVVYTDESRSDTGIVLHHLRQQKEKRRDDPQLCLSDYVAPAESGVPDWIGAFAVTAGQELAERVEAFKQAHDDYNAILVEALADRLAEAFAECMHARVRREFWGYAADETLSSQQLIREEYCGIRPAPGYPACPDHTEKTLLWELLEVERHTGIRLTESLAMWPAASVSGFYLSHPESRYFALGKIGRDQVADYAERKGMDLREAERWLAPVLGYETGEEADAAA
jgi:5-methyltetrahydrofolate--homocysteine methyltransferase